MLQDAHRFPNWRASLPGRAFWCPTTREPSTLPPRQILLLCVYRAELTLNALYRIRRLAHLLRPSSQSRMRCPASIAIGVAFMQSQTISLSAASRQSPLSGSVLLSDLSFHLYPWREPVNY